MKKLLTLTMLMLTSIAFAQKPVYDLLERISKGSSNQFLFEVSNTNSTEDYFEIAQKGSKIWIKGNNNISVATGLNWYLKYYAGVNITWNQPTTKLAKKLPAVTTPERRSTEQLKRYYFNYCTFSYTMAFWDWKRWQQEIDFMALHGINLPLSIVGASTAWRNTLLRLGYSTDEVNNFIAGPAHQAWWLMNNLEGAGGPNPDSYYEDQAKLEQQIIAGYREWGIEPVLAGYAGMTPRNAKEKLGLNVQDPGTWCGYDRPAFLQPEDPRFAEIAKIYYEETTKLFGKANYYAIDPFHEGGSIEGVNLAAAGTAIYNAMKAESPEAVWVVQSWQSTPYQAMINSVPKGKVIVLDLFSESRPQWGDPKSPWYRKNGFEQHEWIYCMLLNFGGNVGMYGKMDRTIDSYYMAKAAKQGETLVGVGATAEGVENNPMMYELLFELPWRKDKFTKEEWLKTWIKARYGRNLPQLDKAWEILMNTAYSPAYESTQEGTTESVFCARPSFSIDRVSCCSTIEMYYQEKEFEKALALMLEVSKELGNSENYIYDLTDIARQALANRGNTTYPVLCQLFKDGKKDEFRKLSDKFLEMILLQDRMTASHPSFMVGTWLEMARNMGHDAAQKDFYQQNGRQQITTWGNRFSANNGGLKDYSHREWSGMLRDFYYVRWKYFFDCMNSTGELEKDFDWFDLENEWVEKNKTIYPSKPQNDAVKMAREVYDYLKK